MSHGDQHRADKSRSHEHAHPHEHAHHREHAHEPHEHAHHHEHAHPHEHAHHHEHAHEPHEHAHHREHAHEPHEHAHHREHAHEPHEHAHHHQVETSGHDHHGSDTHGPRHGQHHGGFRIGQVPSGWRKDQEPRFGSGKILFFDAFSGIAGDMTVAALVDLGVPPRIVHEAVQATGLEGYCLHFRHGYVGSIGAVQFDVEVGQGQRERDFQSIDRMIREATLSDGVRNLARSIFARLARAEAAVHRTAVESVHFHEVGAVDSIADIVGAAACIEYIGAAIWTAPLPMGRGFIQCRHGTIPLPAPATVMCLEGVATKDAGIEAELVTPTGAAIIGSVAERSVTWPSLMPYGVGWGAGSRVLPDRPNLLRVVLGELAGLPDAEQDSDHVVLEANVDDATGELVGHALGLLLEQGALDAWAVPVTMKKGRPGVVLSAIVGSTDEARLTALMIRETTTLGVRRHAAGRTVRPRRMIEVQTPFGSIPIKVSEGPFGPPQVKPEFDHCVKLARERQVPVREVLSAAISSARRVLEMDAD